jgi:hypothetical protein
MRLDTGHRAGRAAGGTGRQAHLIVGRVDDAAVARDPAPQLPARSRSTRSMRSISSVRNNAARSAFGSNVGPTR